jgi:hypothetical protein
MFKGRRSVIEDRQLAHSLLNLLIFWGLLARCRRIFRIWAELRLDAESIYDRSARQRAIVALRFTTAHRAGTGCAAYCPISNEHFAPPPAF